MKYTLVKPDGSTAHSFEFDIAPIIPANKGVWLADNPPTYNPQTHQLVRNPVQSVNAAEIAYTVSARDIQTVRNEKLQEIEAARDNETHNDVSVFATTWQADERSQKLLGDALTLATLGAPLPPVWRDAVNVNMEITSIGQLATIAGAMAVQTQAAYDKSWALKVQIEQANTVEAINSITW